MKKNFYLIFLVIFGLFIRAYNITFQSLWIDEGFSLLAGKSVLEHGLPILPSGSFYNSGKLLSYLIAASDFIMSDIHYFRFISLIFGVLFIIVIYYFTKEIYGDNVALITALFVTFSELFILWSRQIRSYSILFIFFYLTLLFLIKFLKTNEKKYLILYFISLFLAVDAHLFALSLIPISIIYLILFLDLKWLKDFFKKTNILLLLIIGMIVFIFVSQAINFSFYEGVNYFWYYINFLFSNYYFVVFLALIAPLMKFKKIDLFLIITFIIPFIILSYYTKLYAIRYISAIIPILFILCSKTIANIPNLLKSKFSFLSKDHYLKNKFFDYLIIFCFIFLVFTNSFVFIPKSEYYVNSLVPQPPFDEMYAWLEENLNNRTLIDSYPHMTYLYMDKVSDYKPNFRLIASGRERRNNSFYMGIPLITTFEKFNSTNVFIIMDDMSRPRINDTNKLEEVIKFGSGNYRSISIYRVKPKFDNN